MPVEADRALCRIIEAWDQVEDCALARATRSDKCENFSSLNIQRYILQNWRFAIIGERDISKTDLTTGGRQGNGIWSVHNCWIGIQDFKDTLHAANCGSNLSV